MADRVVAVARAANELTAGMLAGLLADNGIRCGTKNVGAGLAYATPALDPHEILVLESEVQRAAAVLAPYAGNDLTLLVPAPPIDDEAAQ